MALSLNKVVVAGRLGKDPDIRNVGDGRVANMRVAVGERYKDKKTGEYKEVTEWIPVVVWNDATVGFIEQYVKKGSAVYVEGQFKTRSYKSNNDEKETYVTELVVRGFNGTVQLLDAMPKRDGGSSDRGSSRGSTGGGNSGGGYPLDDDIPFGPEFR